MTSLSPARKRDGPAGQEQHRSSRGECRRQASTPALMSVGAGAERDVPVRGCELRTGLIRTNDDGPVHRLSAAPTDGVDEHPDGALGHLRSSPRVRPADRPRPGARVVRSGRLYDAAALARFRGSILVGSHSTVASTAAEVVAVTVCAGASRGCTVRAVRNSRFGPAAPGAGAGVRAADGVVAARDEDVASLSPSFSLPNLPGGLRSLREADAADDE